MGIENKGYNPSEEELNNTVENKETKEYVNLTFASAADLVKQIEEKGYFDRNDYQETCKYAVIHNKNTGENKVWNFEREEEDDEYPVFHEQLPTYFKEANDENLQVFFCGSMYDIPLVEINESRPKYDYDALTPDGVHYQTVMPPGNDDRTITYDEKRFSIDEVQKAAKIAEEDVSKFHKEQGLRSFIRYDYDLNNKLDKS